MTVIPPTPLVLFDMDGTLLDTRHDIARAANGARHELGLPVMTIDEVVRAVGDGVDLFVSRVTYPKTDERFAAARKVFLRHYAENVIGETTPYDGIIPMLDKLIDLDIPLAVVSNKPEKLVDELVRHFGWQRYFRTWLGGDSAARAKPAQDPLLLAMQQSGVAASHPLIMVGDGDQDILAAKAMGCKAVWCSWGFNSQPTNDYPSHRVDHPEQVLLTITNY